jgi:uncharacterized protein YdaU (DUF1376 family)
MDAAMKYPWMPLFWGDFLANTMHLSAQEAGAYLFLIAHAWEHEGEIPVDWIRLARIAHVRQNHWARVWKALEPFFEPFERESLIKGVPYKGLHHKRVLIELHNAAELSNKRKGAALQMHSKRTANASVLHMHMHPPSQSLRDASLGKGREAPTMQVQVNWRDPGNDYRSPPRAKSDNVLTPLSDKPLLVAAKQAASEE